MLGPEPRRLHPLSPVLDLVGAVPSILFLGLITPSSLVLLPAVLALGGVLVAVRFVGWSRFSYAVVGRELIVESGVISRSRRVVPLDRIQQIDIQRRIRHRVAGLSVVRIDTAVVGDAAEVVLDAVSEAEAERLRTVLRSAGPVAPTVGEVGGAAGDHEREVLRIPAARLAVAGLTGSKLLVVFVAIGALMGIVDDLRPRWGEDSLDAVAGASRPETLAVVVVVGLALVGWLAVAAGASIVSDGGYRMTRRHDVLRVRRGLLDQREASIELHRVQAVWIRENPARRALGLVSVTIQSAGGAEGADGGDSRIDVPILARRDLGGLLAEVLPAAAEPPPLLPPPPAARRRTWVRSVGPVALLVVAVGTAVLLLDAGPSAVGAFGVAAVLGLAAAATAAEVGFAARGWTATPELVVAREGGLIRVTALVPSAKVQSTRLRSSPFQRRVDLATLALDVAGRGDTPRILDVEVDRLERLRLDALAAPAARRDEGAVRRGP